MQDSGSDGDGDGDCDCTKRISSERRFHKCAQSCDSVTNTGTLAVTFSVHLMRQRWRQKSIKAVHRYTLISKSSSTTYYIVLCGKLLRYGSVFCPALH